MDSEFVRKIMGYSAREAASVAEVTAAPNMFVPVKMTSADITRKSVDGPAIGIDDEIKRLAVESSSVLGYGGLRNEIFKPLRDALSKLEISILDESRVTEYKVQLLKELYERQYSMRSSWDRMPIAQYVDPIPEFVLRKAIQIKKEVPDAQLFIDRLYAHPDPFLYVILGPETYCVEVWDEPKFEFNRATS